MDYKKDKSSRLKGAYPPGTRIELIHMPDCSHPVPDGTTGTVEYVDGHSWIHMTWDNGRTAPIDPEIDTFQGISATPPASSGTLPQALVVKEQEDEHELSFMA